MRPPTVTVTSTVEKKKKNPLNILLRLQSVDSQLTLKSTIPHTRLHYSISQENWSEIHIWAAGTQNLSGLFCVFFFYIIDSMNDVVLKMRRRQIDHWLYWRLTLSEVRKRPPRRFLQQLKLGHVKPLSLLMKSLCTGFTPAALQLQQWGMMGKNLNSAGPVGRLWWTACLTSALNMWWRI